MRHAVRGLKPTVRSAEIRSGWVSLTGDLALTPSARVLVVFAHGDGSSRHSSRNRFVAARLLELGCSTLLLDLLTDEERSVDESTQRYRSDVELLGRRVADARRWAGLDADTRRLPVALFGAETGAAAALVAAAEAGIDVKAVISRSGRPDLAGTALRRVRASTLLVVGSRDLATLRLNEEALFEIRSEKALRVIPGASHRMEEPGALEGVARLTAQWLESSLEQEAGEGG